MGYTTKLIIQDLPNLPYTINKNEYDSTIHTGKILHEMVVLKDFNVSGLIENMMYGEANEKNNISKEDLQDMVDQALESNNEKISNYLKLVDTHKKYSKHNIALINGQTNGNATMVKSFTEWKEQGVAINKGEKALKIWLPRKFTTYVDENNVTLGTYKDLTEEQKNELKQGKLTKNEINSFFLKSCVFDIEQTNAEDVNFEKKLQPKDQVHQTLLKLCSEYELNVSYSTTNNESVLGFATIDNLLSTKKIVLDVNLDTEMMNHVLMHEIAHHRLGHLELDHKERNVNLLEFEAESVAYLVHSKIGEPDDNFTNQYLKHYLEEGDFDLFDTTDNICKIANEIYDFYKLNFIEQSEQSTIEQSTNDFFELLKTSKELLESDSEFRKELKSSIDKLQIENIDDFWINFEEVVENLKENLNLENIEKIPADITFCYLKTYDETINRMQFLDSSNSVSMFMEYIIDNNELETLHEAISKNKTSQTKGMGM